MILENNEIVKCFKNTCCHSDLRLLVSASVQSLQEEIPAYWSVETWLLHSYSFQSIGNKKSKGSQCKLFYINIYNLYDYFHLISVNNYYIFPMTCYQNQFMYGVTKIFFIFFQYVYFFSFIILWFCLFINISVEA